MQAWMQGKMIDTMDNNKNNCNFGPACCGTYAYTFEIDTFNLALVDVENVHAILKIILLFYHEFIKNWLK